MSKKFTLLVAVILSMMGFTAKAADAPANDYGYKFEAPYLYFYNLNPADGLKIGTTSLLYTQNPVLTIKSTKGTEYKFQADYTVKSSATSGSNFIIGPVMEGYDGNVLRLDFSALNLPAGSYSVVIPARYVVNNTMGILCPEVKATFEIGGGADDPSVEEPELPDYAEEGTDFSVKVDGCAVYLDGINGNSLDVSAGTLFSEGVEVAIKSVDGTKTYTLTNNGGYSRTSIAQVIFDLAAAGITEKGSYVLEIPANFCQVGVKPDWKELPAVNVPFEFDPSNVKYNGVNLYAVVYPAKDDNNIIMLRFPSNYYNAAYYGYGMIQGTATLTNQNSGKVYEIANENVYYDKSEYSTWAVYINVESLNLLNGAYTLDAPYQFCAGVTTSMVQVWSNPIHVDDIVYMGGEVDTFNYEYEIGGIDGEGNLGASQIITVAWTNAADITDNADKTEGGVYITLTDSEQKVTNLPYGDVVTIGVEPANAIAIDLSGLGLEEGEYTITIPESLVFFNAGALFDEENPEITINFTVTVPTIVEPWKVTWSGPVDGIITCDYTDQEVFLYPDGFMPPFSTTSDVIYVTSADNVKTDLKKSDVTVADEEGYFFTVDISSYNLAPGTYTLTIGQGFFEWVDYDWMTGDKGLTPEFTYEFEISDGSSVKSLIESGKVRVFNLNGVEVANPEHGIYIKVANGKATKVVL